LTVWTWKTQPRINWKLKLWSIRILTRRINLSRFIRQKMKTWRPKKFLAILPWCWWSLHRVSIWKWLSVPKKMIVISWNLK
jgi:hypothetical protein